MGLVWLDLHGTKLYITVKNLVWEVNFRRNNITVRAPKFWISYTDFLRHVSPEIKVQHIINLINHIRALKLKLSIWGLKLLLLPQAVSKNAAFLSYTYWLQHFDYFRFPYSKSPYSRVLPATPWVQHTDGGTVSNTVIWCLTMTYDV